MCFTTFSDYEWLISDLGDLKCAFLVTSLSFVYKIMNLEIFILKEYFAHISEKSTYQNAFQIMIQCDQNIRLEQAFLKLTVQWKKNKSDRRHYPASLSVGESFGHTRL